mgnify:CR=1 FL=1
MEQSDGAVIGSLVNQGADITMKNLLTAVRVRGKSAMDYKVDDTFAGVDSVSSGIKIDSQIESAYHTNCLGMCLIHFHLRNGLCSMTAGLI